MGFQPMSGMSILLMEFIIHGSFEFLRTSGTTIYPE